jgi:hypothetical protein
MPSLISIVVVLSSLPAGRNIICCAGCSLHVGPGRAYRVSDAACGNHSGEQGGKQAKGKGFQRGCSILQVALERRGAIEVARPFPRLDLQRDCAFSNGQQHWVPAAVEAAQKADLRWQRNSENPSRIQASVFNA